VIAVLQRRLACHFLDNSHTIGLQYLRACGTKPDQINNKKDSDAPIVRVGVLVGSASATIHGDERDGIYLISDSQEAAQLFQMNPAASL
jgi:hypothetical protein